MVAFCESCLKEIEAGVLCAACAEAQKGAENGALCSHSPSGAPQFHPQFTAPAALPAGEEKRFEMPLTAAQLPHDFKSLSAWGFVGYGLLFLIPLMGWVVAVMLACGATSRVCLKHYARGVLLSWALVLLVAAAVVGALWYGGVDIAAWWNAYV